MLLNHFTHKNKAELLFKMDIYTKDTNNFKRIITTVIHPEQIFKQKLGILRKDTIVRRIKFTGI